MIEWRDIPGYDGKYQASEDGDVRHVYPSGHTRLLTPFRKSERSHASSRNRYVYKLSRDGRGREVAAINIMVATYLGGRRSGMVAYHKDGILSNNHRSNIGFITRSELGKLTGAQSSRRPVRKVDESGEIVEIYRSAREAGRQNHMSYQTVLDRCNHRVKQPYRLDGFNYEWDAMDD